MLLQTTFLSDTGLLPPLFGPSSEVLQVNGTAEPRRPLSKITTNCSHSNLIFPHLFLTPTQTTSGTLAAAFGNDEECAGTKQGGEVALTARLTIQKPQPVCRLAQTSLPAPFPARFLLFARRCSNPTEVCCYCLKGRRVTEDGVVYNSHSILAVIFFGL